MDENRLELLFVRHAQSKGNAGIADPDFHPDDPPLTDTGLRQAEALARRFAPGDLDAICAGTLIRSMQTVQPTAEKLRMQIETDPDFNEVDTSISGTSMENVEDLAPRALNSAAAVLPACRGGTCAGETPAACAARAKRAIGRLLARHGPGERVLICTHGAFFGYLIRECLGTSLPEPFAWQVDNCAVTAIALRAGAPPLLLFANDRSHFYMQDVL